MELTQNNVFNVDRKPGPVNRLTGPGFLSTLNPLLSVDSERFWR